MKLIYVTAGWASYQCEDSYTLPWGRWDALCDTWNSGREIHSVLFRTLFPRAKAAWNHTFRVLLMFLAFWDFHTLFQKEKVYKNTRFSSISEIMNWQQKSLKKYQYTFSDCRSYDTHFFSHRPSLNAFI